MKERNISGAIGALLPVSLSASVLLAGSLYRKSESCRKLKADCRCLRIQNEYLKEWDSELSRRQRMLRAIRHEMTNEYILEMGYLEKGLYRQLEEHYREKTEYFDREDELINTGSVGMDSILNAKLREAKREGAAVDFEHQIDGKLKIDDSDLNTLIGNLMNNAIEAVRALRPEEKRIKVRVKADGATLFLEVSNPYQGERKKSGSAGYLTQKSDRQLHGLGLLQIKKVVYKYDGRIEIRDKNHCFDVRVLLYQCAC